MELLESGVIGKGNAASTLLSGESESLVLFNFGRRQHLYDYHCSMAVSLSEATDIETASKLL